MIDRIEKQLIGYVPYSRRQIMLMPDGLELQRQHIYMLEESWTKLRDLCHAQKLGGSQVIALLIKEAHKVWCKDTLIPVGRPAQ